MPKSSRPRYGSMRFWPRKRSAKMLPRVSWEAVKSEEKGLKGFIGYKVGMVSVLVKDVTSDSMTKGKRITIPATIVECPELKIFSVRAYKKNQLVEEIVVSKDKELRKLVKIPKQTKKIEDLKKDSDDIRIIVYTDIKNKLFKKTPDLTEMGLEGSKDEKLGFVKEHIEKGIKISDVITKGLVDLRGITKGKGLQGPVKRFGISLRSHKAEKGVRRPGSIGPWHPARVNFRIPMAGQTGFHTRIVYNSSILDVKNIQEKDINPSAGFHKYGKVKNDYLILAGSLQGPIKRELLITKAIRPTKKTLKKQYEVLEVL